jgi:hypothetical protein
VKSAPFKLALLCIVAWLTGVLAYVGALALFYRQSISSGDFVAVLQWSAIGFVLAFILIYLPVLLGLHRMLGGVRPRWAFPFVAAFLGIAPTAFILFYLGGGVRSLVSQEASLFYAMFAVDGLIIGIGYTRIYANIA